MTFDEEKEQILKLMEEKKMWRKSQGVKLTL